MEQTPPSPDPHTKTGGEHLEGRGRCAAEKLDPACLETIKQLKIRRRHRYIIFQIVDDTVVVENAGARDAGVAELRRDLPPTECRYALYDHEYTTPDGRRPSKLFFLCWTPASSTPYAKMAYSHGRPVLRDKVEGVVDVVCQAPDALESTFGIEQEESEESDIDM